MAHANQSWLLTAVIALALTGAAEAAVLVSYGGDGMVAGNQTFNSGISSGSAAWQQESDVDGGTDFNGDGDQFDRVAWRTFDLDAPWSPAAGYSGPAFYGGFSLLEDDDNADDSADAGSKSDGATESFIITNDNPDDIRPVNRRAAMDLALVFATSQPGVATAGDSISITIGQDTQAFGRYLVISGGTAYLSQSQVNGGTQSIDPAAETWAVYGIADGSKDMIATNLTFNVPGTNLTDITHVGYYSRNGDASGAVLELRGLTADVTPIPEPATVALLALGGAIMCTGRKRRS